MKPLKAAPKMTPPKWDDFFNPRVMKAAESLPCINVVCFCRQLVTLAVTARWRASARAQQRLVTAVVGYQSYFHLACISNMQSILHPQFLSQPWTLTSGLRMLLLLLQPWYQAGHLWVARGLAGHCSHSRATTSASVDTGVKSRERTVPHAKCALGRVWFTEWNENSKRYQEALLTRGWSEKHPSDRSGRSWWDEDPYGKGKGRKEKKSIWSGFCCFLLVLHTLYLIRNVFHSCQNTTVNQ